MFFCSVTDVGEIRKLENGKEWSRNEFLAKGSLAPGQIFLCLALLYELGSFFFFPIFNSLPFRALFLSLLPTQSTHEERRRR